MTWLGFHNAKKGPCPNCEKTVYSIVKDGQVLYIDKTFGHPFFYMRGDIHACKLSDSIETDKGEE